MKKTLFDRLKHDQKVNYGGAFVIRDRRIMGLHGMQEATPFVMDRTAVRMAMDLREELLADPEPWLLDLALPPFEETWIEYDPRDKLPPERVTEDTAIRVGHLVTRGSNGCAFLTVEQHQHNSLLIIPASFGWSTDGRPYPGRIITEAIQRGKAPRQETEAPADKHKLLANVLLSGNGSAATPWWQRIGFTIHMDPDESINKVVYMLHEQRACLGLLAAMFALMARAPTQRTVLQPVGRWIGRGGKRHPYERHTVVRVEVSPRVVYTAIRNAQREETVRRAEHDVRSHLRCIRRGRPDEYWVTVRAHKRGDPSVGIVTHDRYEAVTVERHRGPQ